jgi:uncharacterized protein YabE (DUF348 family)
LNRTPIAELLRVATLLLVTFVAFGASWQLATTAGAAARNSSALLAQRAEPAGRAVSAAARVASAFDLPDSRATTSGVAIILSAGIPLTVLDSGRARQLRAPRGTSVPEVLDLAGITLGPLDRVAGPDDGTVEGGDVIQVVRVSESQTVLREAVPFPVQTVNDATLPVGKVVMTAAGAPGVADNTYVVRSADGVVSDRVLLSSTTVVAPTPEVRHVGTFRPPPPAGGDIEAIIRAAAAQWGASPDQLLRVAYCESHYNPSAYNASSGASGLFQFLATTWAANSVRAGYAGASVFDPVANANTAAMMFARGQAAQWQCK